MAILGMVYIIGSTTLTPYTHLPIDFSSVMWRSLGEMAGLQLHNGRVSLLQLLSQPWRQLGVDSWRCCRKTLGKPMGKPWENGGFMGIKGDLASGKRLHRNGKIHHSSWENSPFQLGHGFNSKLLNYRWVRAKEPIHLRFNPGFTAKKCLPSFSFRLFVFLGTNRVGVQMCGDTRSNKG